MGASQTHTMRVAGASSPATSDFTEPETELVMSPTSTSTAYAIEDPLELLKRYKTVFVIADSASMTGERWEEVSS